jgi:rfaE bifunctional protein kinase chain/domain
MDIKELSKKLQTASDIVITVFGDYCLDKYLYIDADKDEDSLETGLTAYQVTKKGLYPGAAGTVVNNLRSLKVQTLCVGVIGDDGEGYDLLNALKKIGADTSYMVTDGERCTSAYTKPMRGGEELNRLDFKNFTPMSKQTEQKLIENLYAAVSKSNAVIVLDQFTEENCNTVNSAVREEIAVIADKYPDLIIYADSRAYIHLFKNIMVKCNDHEIKDSGEELYKKNGKPVFVTMGRKGSAVFDKDGSHRIGAVTVRGPVDICGAGDACTAGIVLGLTLGASPPVAAMLGNIIASITIKQIGVTGTATQEQVAGVIFNILYENTGNFIYI